MGSGLSKSGKEKKRRHKLEKFPGMDEFIKNNQRVRIRNEIKYDTEAGKKGSAFFEKF
jgi:hypothetical protein